MTTGCHRSAPLAIAALAIGCLASGIGAMAAELQPRANRAYDAYLEQATARFLARARTGGIARTQHDGVLPGRPGGEDGIIRVPAGLVHHWVGAVVVRRATLDDALAVSCAYDAYSSIYRTVIASRLLARDGDTYRVQVRLKESESGITAVLDVRSTVRYVHLTKARAYVVSEADEIREVKNAGRRDEQRLPPGRDSGYLWRANTFSYFEELDGDLYAEMETLGLSRGFPPLLGWFIEPIARRVGRRSVERSLAEFGAAIQAERLSTTGCR